VHNHLIILIFLYKSLDNHRPYTEQMLRNFTFSLKLFAFLYVPHISKESLLRLSPLKHSELHSKPPVTSRLSYSMHPMW
jgi:hypothetical protein